jgi:hypothetical protein
MAYDQEKADMLTQLTEAEAILQAVREVSDAVTPGVKVGPHFMKVVRLLTVYDLKYRRE